MATKTAPPSAKKWTPSPAPKHISFVYDGIDKSLLYRAVRETKQITENLMNDLYPGWRWDKQTKHWSEKDQRRCVRRPEDVTIEEVLAIFFAHESFTAPLWNMIRGRTGSVEVVELDLIPFLKVFCCLMFYKCTIHEFFHDAEGMYKTYPMAESISEKKFRAIINSAPSHGTTARTQCPAGMRSIPAKTYSTDHLRPCVIYKTHRQSSISQPSTCRRNCPKRLERVPINVLGKGNEL